MAKNIIHGKTGKIVNDRKRYGDMLNDFYKSLDAKKNSFLNPLPKQRGIKAIVIDAYEKGGIEAARSALKIAEERIRKATGKECVYPPETVDEWIKEYEEQQTR